MMMMIILPCLTTIRSSTIPFNANNISNNDDDNIINNSYSEW